MKYPLTTALIVCALLKSSVLAQTPDTLYHWSFPNSSWVQAGTPWTNCAGFIQAYLWADGDSSGTTNYSTLISPEVNIPFGTDSLWVILNFNYDEYLYSSNASAYATALICVVFDSDTVWSEFESACLANKYRELQGPVSIPIDSIRSSNQPHSISLYSRVFAFAIYGSSYSHTVWNISDITVLNTFPTAFEGETWGSIKNLFP